MINKKRIDVVAAIIKQGSLFLIAKRSVKQNFSLKWEFPGGKVENNESFENALVREIKEELCVKVKVLEKLAVEFIEDKENNLAVHYYYAKIESGVVRLIEHSDYKWVRKSDFDRSAM